jgi:ABC-type transport system substrate-binding protein
VNLLTLEAWKLEAQTISIMLSRIGLKEKVVVLTRPEWTRKFLILLLDKPPNEQDWDLSIVAHPDYYGYTRASFLRWIFIEESGHRWIEYDPVCENMWKKMTRTVDRDAQEEMIQQMVHHLYERAYRWFVYSPITLYAVDKEVNFGKRSRGIRFQC